MPLAGDILPALPNGDQRWREQQRSVGRLERNRREKRVGVRAPTRGAQQRSTPPRRDRGRAEPKRAVVRALVRADAKPERRRARASTHVKPARRKAAPRRAHAKAHAKAEEAAAPAPQALNRPPARTARSKHSAVALNGPRSTCTRQRSDHLDEPPAVPPALGRDGFFLTDRFIRRSVGSTAHRRRNLSRQALGGEITPCKLFYLASSFHFLPLTPAIAHPRSRGGRQSGKYGVAALQRQRTRRIGRCGLL
jgi:hypothetical protein